METPNITLNTIEEKRNYLRQISKSVTDLVTAGEFENINEAVIATFYKDETHTNFKTFNQWKADGYSIKKGSKAFIVWGKPKRVQDSEQATAKGQEPQTDDEGRDFFPIAFLFSNAQVEKREGVKNA